MKILQVHDFYQQFGGEDATALSERELLERNGATVVFYSRRNDTIKRRASAETLVIGAQAIYSRTVSREITKLVEDQRPDVACIHNVFPLISPAVYHTLHSLGVPTIQIVKNFRFWCPSGTFYTHGEICERCKFGDYWHAVQHRCYRDSYLLSALYAASVGLNRMAGMMEKIDAFICLTEFSRQKLLEVGIPAAKIFVRPHFIDTSQVEPAWQDGKYAVYLGRLSPEKGVWALVKAFEQMPEISLKIAGTGPLEGALKAYVAEKGLRNVEFVGFQQSAEKWPLLQDSLFTVAPSEFYETFGMVVIESYAAGKAVIGSNLGSLAYVIEDGESGLLFRPGDVDDLVEKVRFLAARPGVRQRMGRYARTLAETKYGQEQNYADWLRILEAVIGPLAPQPVTAEAK